MTQTFATLRRPLACGLCALGGLLVTSPARAELAGTVRADAAPTTGGVYGRFEGDLDLGLFGGTIYHSQLGAAAGGSAHYYWTLGAVAQFEQYPTASESETQSRGQLALELRPLFLSRWALDLERGPALLDLTLDSLAVGLGGYRETDDAGDSESGLLLSVGFGLPLMSAAEGLWLTVRGQALFPSQDTAAQSQGAALLLSWHWLTLVSDSN